MATTTPMEFDGTPTLTLEKVENIKDWYKLLLGDADKATDADDHSYYQGGVDMAVSVLKLLHNYPDSDKELV